MTANILDLRSERCPMALLLAKRRSKILNCGESLTIYVSDQASMSDILRYLASQSLQVEVHHEPSFSVISVVHLSRSS